MKKYTLALASIVALSSTSVFADSEKNCKGLPSHAALQAALNSAVDTETSGLDNDMWGALVNRDGVICAIAFSGEDRGDQWAGSRAIAAQKANTANAFSLPKGAGGVFDGLALSTANLFSAVQPGGSLFGLQHSNPVDTDVAYKGPAKKFGTKSDPMVGKKMGGVNVFGGGAALYDETGELVGAIGVSGDTSCSDHFIAWRTRNNLGLDFVPAGVAANGDNIIFDINAAGVSASGFGHPTCILTGDETALPLVSVIP